jgi:hypothetical protein
MISPLPPPKAGLLEVEGVSLMGLSYYRTIIDYGALYGLIYGTGRDHARATSMALVVCHAIPR